MPFIKNNSLFLQSKPDKQLILPFVAENVYDFPDIKYDI